MKDAYSNIRRNKRHASHSMNLTLNYAVHRKGHIAPDFYWKEIIQVAQLYRLSYPGEE